MNLSGSSKFKIVKYIKIMKNYFPLTRLIFTNNLH